jgi:uncharacterized membrane protein SpoIIM required for sporulation
MTEELGRKLAELAEKLGTTVEHLWGVLIRQAYIDGVSSLVTILLALAFGFGAVLFFFHVRKDRKKYLGEYAPAFVEYFILAVALFLVAAAVGTNLYWVISDFFNPEFYALRHLPGL